MKIKPTQKAINEIKAEQIILGHCSDQQQNDLIEALGSEISDQFSSRLKHKDFEGKSGQTLTLYNQAGQVITVVGLGKADKVTPTALYEANHKVTKTVAKSRVEHVANFLATMDYPNVDAEQATKLVTLASAHAAYRYEDTKSFKKDNLHQIKTLEALCQKLRPWPKASKQPAIWVTTHPTFATQLTLQNMPPKLQKKVNTAKLTS